jgi:hypothetical protein
VKLTFSRRSEVCAFCEKAYKANTPFLAFGRKWLAVSMGYVFDSETGKSDISFELEECA